MFDDIDGFMRAAFLVEFVGVPVVRSRFAGLQWGQAKGWHWRESPIYMVGGIPFGFALVYSVGAYLVAAELPWLYLGLPNVVRWVGLAASFVVSGFLIWVFATIGVAGAKVVVTFDDMKLVTHGPYSRIRHPMYVGFGLWGITWMLFTDNWAVGAVVVGFMVFIALFRVPHEERVLTEHFGDAYRQYMARTSRFLPIGPGTGRTSR
jgi:protein-S-isoprenylcysteine O-methyltransferase Ste14